MNAKVLVVFDESLREIVIGLSSECRESVCTVATGNVFVETPHHGGLCLSSSLCAMFTQVPGSKHAILYSLFLHSSSSTIKIWLIVGIKE